MAELVPPARGRQRRPGTAGGATARLVASGPRTAPTDPAAAAAEPGDALLSPGQELEVEIVDVAQGGWCVARPDGLPVIFVRHTLPGERVVARVTEVTAKLARADAVRVLSPSPDRVEAPCPSARPGGCGGCDWQHATLPAQRALKAAVLTQQLRRLAGIERTVTVEPLPGDEDVAADSQATDGRAAAPGFGWRTRVQFAVDARGLAGLRGHRSHQVIDIGDCLIAHPEVRRLDIPGDSWGGARGVEVAVGGADSAENFAVTVVEPAPKVKSKGRRNGSGRPPRPAHSLVEGRAVLVEQAAGRLWQVSAGGFWQVHPAAAGTLAQAVLEALRPAHGDSVLDLYCGAGLFAGAVAPLVGEEGSVTGIESDQAAVRNARQNLSDCPWADVRHADVAAVLSGPDAPAARLVIADPPRTGLAREVVSYLLGENPAERFAYVSCDPATLARDLGLLTAGGWRLDDLRAFDAFPMTHHVECVATLSR